MFRFDRFGNYPRDVDYDYGVRFKDPLMSEMSLDLPRIDVKDRGKFLEITADLPGVKKEDIKLNLEEDGLEISADLFFEESSDPESIDGYYRKERSYKGFYRALRLPVQISPEKSTAKYTDGILKINAPKAEVQKSLLEVE